MSEYKRAYREGRRDERLDIAENVEAMRDEVFRAPPKESDKDGSAQAGKLAAFTAVLKHLEHEAP